MILVVEGIQGVGKTTFCKSLVKNYPDVILIEEWVDKKLLSDYISDMKNKATQFQILAQEKTLENIKKAEKLAEEGKIVLIDRGIIGNRCFAEVQYEKGYISNESMVFYRDKYNYERIKNESNIKIKVLYLKCKLEEVLKRIKTRGRNGEENYDIDYLRKIQDKHEKLINPDYVYDTTNTSLTKRREYKIYDTFKQLITLKV